MQQVTTLADEITMKPCKSKITYEELCRIGREEVLKQNSRFAQDRKRIIREKAQALMVNSVGYVSIPPRFKNASFDNYEIVNDKAQKALSTAREYAQNFHEHREKAEGLIFLGTPGTGKTHLACSICRAAMDQGYQSLFTTVLGMIQVVKESFGSGMKTFMDPDLLVLDEIGVQNKTPHELTALTEIINDRYANLKPTILLTNLSTNQLRELLDYRVASRLRESNKTIPMKWEDYRAR